MIKEGNIVSRKFEIVTTVILLLCAVVTTGIVIWKFVLQEGNGGITKPTLVSNWQRVQESGTRMGSRQAPVQIILFSDFECPFCAQFDRALNAVQRTYPDKIAVTLVHFPLPMHQFAVPAATAAECAGEQGRFREMYDELFKGQQNFGSQGWDEFASRAGVRDLDQFKECIARPGENPRVSSGRRVAQSLEVSATPTVIINGWRVGPMSEVELRHNVQRVLEGKRPI